MLTGVLVLAVFFLFGDLVYLFPYVYVGYGLFAMYGVMFMLTPIMAGILSRYMPPTEQGVAIGTLHAVQGLTAAIGPFMFSYIYKALENDGFLKTTSFNVAAVIALLAVPMVLYPLSKAMKEQDLKIPSTKDNSGDPNNINEKKCRYIEFTKHIDFE